MLSSIAAWLASEGAAMLLGALAKFLSDIWIDYQAKRQQQQIAADAAKKSAVIAEHREPEDAAARLDRGNF